MGYMQHHSIVVTGTRENVLIARKAAKKAFRANNLELVSHIVKSSVNGYASFFVAPDGSKAGWSTDEEGNAARAALIEKLWKLRDDQVHLSWVEIQYGDDNRVTAVMHHSDERDSGD